MERPPLQLTPTAGRETCPLCRAILAESEEIESCEDCQTRYHEACYLELGGCSTLGCKGRSGARACVTCAHGIDAGDVVVCCGRELHQACLTTDQGCGASGCPRARQRPEPAGPPLRVRLAAQIPSSVGLDFLAVGLGVLGVMLSHRQIALAILTWIGALAIAGLGRWAEEVRGGS
jgi:RING finger family protein